MPTVGRDIARKMLAIIALIVATSHADTNLTILSNVGTTVTIQDHQVLAIPSLGSTTTWALADPTFAYNNDQLRSHPGRVTLGCPGGGFTIANSSDDGYVRDLRIHYGQAEELYNFTTASPKSPRANVDIADDGLSGLMNLSALTLIGINFSTPDLTLVLPDTISFIEISGTTVEDLSFTASDISTLAEVVLLQNAFTTLPKFFYEQRYPQEELNITLELLLPISMELPAEYFANLKANLDKFTGWINYVSLQDSCSNGTNNSNPIVVSVCSNGEAIPADSGSFSADGASGSNTSGGRNSGLASVMLGATMTLAVLLTA
ncbi:hypothetical protein PHYPSEUDO_005396 [Phytophthora pseudosyringae]|uniref:Uncharacterized protein n=1 Tax=Phytophthora pseudosyringae TaxID=221518 RepID=A0A8T1VL47_9STRA|nr:hypothetical protein PHYPSEUDO_005396 [Phytophthora pseudosyringae]